MREISDPVADRIASGLDQVLGRQLSADESRWVSRIEELRDRLSRCTDPVAIADYGAGDATDNRTEKEMLDGVVKETTVGDACRASKPYFWSLLLFKLVRHFRPTTLLEMGTCLGVSAAYQSAALKLNGGGSLTTLEGAPALAELAQNNLRSLELDNAKVIPGRFADTLQPTIESQGPFDYVFIDGHHDEHATIDYFHRLLPHLLDPALLVFDDISWSPGMCRAWKKIREDERVALSIDLHMIGLCIVKQGSQPEKRHFEFRMPV